MCAQNSGSGESRQNDDLNHPGGRDTASSDGSSAPQFRVSSVSTTITSAPFNFGDTGPSVVSDSHSPYAPDGPQIRDSGALHDGQATIPPTDRDTGSVFPSTPSAYTTRPPWMVSNSNPPVSPVSSTPPMTSAPSQPPMGSTPPTRIAESNPPMDLPQEQTPTPVQSTPPVAPVESKRPASRRSKRAAKPRRRSRLGGLLLKPFILVLKLVPLAIVGGVGYYGYMSFFGPASDSERNAYLSSPTAGASTGGAAPSSRAGMLIAQVKDVVATHDAGVHAANALAGADGSEQSLSIETGASGPTQAPAPNPYSAPISSTPRSAPSKPGALSGLLDKAKKSVSNATDSVTAAVGSAMASKEDTSSEVTLDFADEPETQIVESRAAPIIVVRQAENTSKMVGLRGRVAPSDSLEPVVARPASASAPDFPGWVSVIEIGEVQDEGHVFVTIDGRQVRPGQIADERLGIRLDRVESTHRVLVFEDALGQTIGKRY